LFIGNGTISEGAPVVGNTEILTEFSDILAFQTTYTYKGEAAGYIVQTGDTPGTPVSQSLQSWMDQWASVKDFGAVGDGVTDDTAAINRALYQLYCREVNPQIRRSLYFPAGVYKINETVIIPPYATLIGEGKDNSVIMMATGDDSALRAYVARTGDSLQQTGANIGNNGAIVPQYVTIQNLGFETEDTAVDVFLVENASNCSFTDVNFMGPLINSTLTSDIDNIAGLRFASSASLVCQTITFDKCTFSGLTYGINTDQQVEGITVSNSKFDTLYQGVVLGVGSPVLGGPTGFRIVQNFFDNIYSEGVKLGLISLNATGYNIFYDVANHFNGTTSPAAPVLEFADANNISISDMFERSSAYSGTYPRIELNKKASIGIINGNLMYFGPSFISANTGVTLVNNVSNTGFYSFNVLNTRSVTINYSITRDTGIRQGSFTVIPTGGGTLTYSDDYNENLSIGVTLTATQAGDVAFVQYTSTNTGVDGLILFTVNGYDT